jgi:hypothetical protein
MAAGLEVTPDDAAKVGVAKEARPVGSNSWNCDFADTASGHVEYRCRQQERSAKSAKSA